MEQREFGGWRNLRTILPVISGIAERVLCKGHGERTCHRDLLRSRKPLDEDGGTARHTHYYVERYVLGHETLGLELTRGSERNQVSHMRHNFSAAGKVSTIFENMKC